MSPFFCLCLLVVFSFLFFPLPDPSRRESIAKQSLYALYKSLANICLSPSCSVTDVDTALCQSPLYRGRPHSYALPRLGCSWMSRDNANENQIQPQLLPRSMLRKRRNAKSGERLLLCTSPDVVGASCDCSCKVHHVKKRGVRKGVLSTTNVKKKSLHTTRRKCKNRLNPKVVLPPITGS